MPARGGEPACLDGDLAAVAARLRRITVRVQARGPGSGSGVIWRTDGLIVTNAHVAGGPARVALSDGQTLEGRLLGWDPERDLAALVIDGNDLPAAEVGDSDALRVGELVIAVGNPLGLCGAVTVGIVHAVAPHRLSRSPLIRADLALAPGNSGGPLADARGRVVGINSMTVGGLALAVPSNVVSRFVGSLARPRAARA